VDAEALKMLKATARSSDAALRCAHEAIFKAMRGRLGAQRAHAVSVASELFTRSKLFRELTLASIAVFTTYAVGVDADVVLPDEPKGEAVRLRRHAVETLAAWEVQFKGQHKQLTLVRKFIRERLGDEAPEVLAFKARREEEARELETQCKLYAEWQKVCADFKRDTLEEMIRAASGCTALLRAFISEKSADDDVEDEEIWEDVSRGVVTESRLDCAVGDGNDGEEGISSVVLKKTNDTLPILEDMRGYYSALKHTYLPALSRLLQILGQLQPAVLDNPAMTTQSRVSLMQKFTELKSTTESVVYDVEMLTTELLSEDWSKRAPLPATNSQEESIELIQLEENARQKLEWKRQVTQFIRRAVRKRSLKDSANKRSKSHNDAVLAELSEDVFTRERRLQEEASEALKLKLISDEMEEQKSTLARGRTAHERIENSLRTVKK
jgi:hypothetical protein